MSSFKSKTPTYKSKMSTYKSKMPKNKYIDGVVIVTPVGVHNQFANEVRTRVPYSYRNRFKLSETLDLLIEKKLEEADETEIYSNKDMADLLALAHKMRMDEMKAQTEMEKAKAGNIKNQVNIQDNSGIPFGEGNYGLLLKKLMKEQ